MRIPRPFADVVALVRDMVAWPREVVLVRAHHRWTGALYLVAVSVPALFGWQPQPVFTWVVLAIGGTSLALDLLGTVAHVAWHRGRIWQAVECPSCGDDPDDGQDPDDDPDVPDDPHGLTLADREWLASIGAAAEKAGR